MSDDLKLLLLTDQRLHAYTWRDGVLAFEYEFEDTPEDIQSFRSYLAQWRESLFRILADIPDESFQIETIPPVRGADRRAIIERKLEQAGSATPFSCALPLGRQREGRGDERLLIATLPRPAYFSPWLEQCQEAQTLVQEITTPALLLSRLIIPPNRHEGRFLLYTLGIGGLRQTCFEDGQLMFSRLTGHHPQNPSDIAAACFHEARRIGHYLQGNRPSPNEKTAFHVLLSKQDAEGFSVATAQESGADIQVMELEALATAHGITTPHGNTSHCETLLLDLWARENATPGFAPAAALHAYQVRQWRSLLAFVGRLGLVAYLVLVAVLGLHTYHLTVEANQTKAANEEARHEYQRRLSTRPALPAPPEALLALETDFQNLNRQSHFPEVTYRLLSHALDQVPEVEVSRIDWRLNNTTEREDGAPPGAPPLSAAQSVMDFSIQPNNNDVAAAQSEILAAQLRRYPGTEVVVIPRNGESREPLSTSAAGFSFRFIQRNVLP